jgi:type II secretory pathway component PulF
MFGEPRIGLKPLAALCRRLALSLGAGVDVRTVWTREENAAQGVRRRRFAKVSDGVARGATMGDSFAETGNYFPEFFRELVHVGETSGHLPEVCRQLADHYEHQLKLRRALLASLTWPVLELALALSVVGLLIWLMGAIPQLAKNKADLLGFGLMGTRGLTIYLTFLAAVGLAGFLVYRAAVRGVFWAAPIQRCLMQVPQLGRALETLAMSRLTWAMYVTLHSGMELRSALRMSLSSTQNAYYKQHIEQVMAAIRSGHEVHEAFRATGAFPVGFLDAVQVGEDSGQLVESMQNLSGQYQEEARAAMNTITILLGIAVTALIAGVIIFLIFRIFSFYVGAINDALKMR